MHASSRIGLWYVLCVVVLWQDDRYFYTTVEYAGYTVREEGNYRPEVSDHSFVLQYSQLMFYSSQDASYEQDQVE